MEIGWNLAGCPNLELRCDDVRDNAVESLLNQLFFVKNRFPRVKRQNSTIGKGSKWIVMPTGSKFDIFVGTLTSRVRDRARYSRAGKGQKRRIALLIPIFSDKIARFLKKKTFIINSRLNINHNVV